MKVNQNTILFGEKLIFVPYKEHHVERYHKWMQSAELLEKTASEPLSLEKEYEMQHSWWIDDDKCTFILLSKQIHDDSPQNEIKAMVGDVNLFFNNLDDKTEAEVEVMIAESSMRGQGLGREAVNVMMFYGFKFLNVKLFSVKIGFDNTASIKLFTKLGFQEESRSEVFGEVTLNLNCDSVDFQEIVKSVELDFKKSNYNTIFK